MSRMPIRDSKGLNTSARTFGGQYPLANRIINDAGYAEPSPKNPSRQFQAGIFKNNIGKKLEFNHKNEELDLQITEVQVAPRGSMLKNRTSTKNFGTARDSNYFNNVDPSMFQSNNLRDEMVQMNAQLYDRVIEEVRQMIAEQKHAS